MDKKTNEKIDRIADLIGLPITCLFIFCLIVPIIFDFNAVSLVSKIFMLIGSLFALALISVIFVFNKKSKNLNKSFYVIFILISILFIFGLVHYFSFNLWGNKIKFWSYLCAFGLIVFVIYKSFQSSKKFTKDFLIQIFLTIACILFFLGIYNTCAFIDNILFKIAFGFLYLYIFLSLIESYLLSKPRIKYNENKYIINLFNKINLNFSSSIVLLKICIIVGTIFTLPIYIKWWILDETTFNYFITIYSCAVGGILTLAGVAWSINNSQKERKNEEIKKAKPYISSKIINTEPEDKQNFCSQIESETDFNNEVYCEIRNSILSISILNKIYHDKKWWKLNNNILLQDSSCLLNFKLNDINDVFLEVNDIYDNAYYYELKVVDVGKLTKVSSIFLHTISNIKEASKDIIKEKTKNDKT